MSIVRALKANVRRGAVLLDDRRPEWFLSVEPMQVDIEDNTEEGGLPCLLHHLYGSYSQGTLALGIELCGYHYGFTFVERPGWEYNWPLQIDLLNDLWRDQIAARRCAWLVMQSEQRREVAA